MSSPLTSSEIPYSLAATGFAVAFMHSSLPAHWLPIVLAARAQKWSSSKTLGVTSLVSGGHVLLTVVLGFMIVLIGTQATHTIGHTLPRLESTILIALGLFYAVRQWKGRGHSHLFASHNHEHCKHERHAKPFAQDRSDWIAFGSLFALMSFSPCESFLPIYLAGIPHGWPGFLILSATLTVAAFLAFACFTMICYSGFRLIKLNFIERYESGIVACLFLVLGAVKLLHTHHHHH